MYVAMLQLCKCTKTELGLTNCMYVCYNKIMHMYVCVSAYGQFINIINYVVMHNYLHAMCAPQTLYIHNLQLAIYNHN